MTSPRVRKADELSGFPDRASDVKREFDEPEARALVDLVVPEEVDFLERFLSSMIFKRGRSGLPGFVLSEERRRAQGGKVKSTLCEGVSAAVRNAKDIRYRSRS